VAMSTSCRKSSAFFIDKISEQPASHLWLVAVAPGKSHPLTEIHAVLVVRNHQNGRPDFFKENSSGVSEQVVCISYPFYSVRGLTICDNDSEHRPV